jgi:DNA polymerase I-like protein with 3'-5' exonuclease and polymerase domains
MARAHADVALMRELRYSLGRPYPDDLAVGPDGRNRVPLEPFASKTGRNQPSSTRFAFGASRWLRGLIRPEPGRALAYVDWAEQEFGIAAALSGDAAMIEAYLSGDPYLALGRQAGLIPPGGTKATHAVERERCKQCVLGVQYGMGEVSLALRIGGPPIFARDLLRLHRATYPDFWRWSDAVEMDAMLKGSLQTVFGWTLRVGDDANPRSLRNFPCQANGAEMLRLACSQATERGVEIVAPVHDAVLIEGSAESIHEVVEAMQGAMAEASEVVLDGFRLRTKAKVVRWTGRYMDERGRGFWGRVMRLLSEAEASARAGKVPT